MARWENAGLEPYPDARGVKWRVIDAGPVATPAPDPEPMTATRRDGTETDIAATLPGLRPRAGLAPDERVRWSADLERGTLR